MSPLGGIVLKGDENPRTELQNGRNEVAGRGDAKMSANMIRRLTETTRMSATWGR